MAPGVVVRVVEKGAAMGVGQRRRHMSKLLETIRCRLEIKLMELSRRKKCGSKIRQNVDKKDWNAVMADTRKGRKGCLSGTGRHEVVLSV